MTKTELLAKAKQIKSDAEALLEKASALRTDAGNSLQSAKRHESALISKKKQEDAERAEREKQERWMEYLNSEENHGVYVSDRDSNMHDQDTEVLSSDNNENQTATEVTAAANAEPAVEQPAEEKVIDTADAKPEKEPKKPAPREDGERSAAKDNRAKPQKEQRPDQRGDRPRRDDTRNRNDKPAFDNRRTGVMDKDKGEQPPRQPQSRQGAPRRNDQPHIPQKEQRSTENKTYVRTFDTEKKAKNKKTIMKETAPSARNWEDDGAPYGSRKKKAQKQVEAHKPEPVVIEKAVITTETITVRDFSEKIGKPASEILKKLFMMNIIANINQDIDYDTCELIALDYNIELEHQVAKTYEETMQEGAEEADREEDLEPRPPVVTIMGHVDHGKTSLLDAIRESSITEGEAGGITQHIGAYTVECNGRIITFIDTPGHEAFTSMRARGAQVTDVVILVVAADDGIMPQTIEAINHSKAAGVPIIVAINKIDKPEANSARIKQQLMEHELLCEEYGGDTICVEVSAKKRMNLDSLLEMVLLQADVLELKANPKRDARGTIIEAQLDKGRGPVATVLVQNGTLKVGDPIVAGIAYGRVRAMMDDKGRSVKQAGPSQPVEVLGFNEVPSAGDVMNVAEVSKKVAEERRNKIKAEQLKNLSKVSLEELFKDIEAGEIKTLNIVVKADVHGSVEAVKQSLEKLSNEEVRVKCIHGGVGAISESDVMFASASNAIVIGFNVRPDSGARALAEQEKVDVRTYRIIYQAIEDVENAMKGLFKPIFKETHLGTISVRNTFKVSSIGTIAGAYVQEGRVTRNALVRVVRDGVVIHEGKIGSLRRFKDDVKEVATGYECGISIEDFNDIHEQDQIEAYIMEEVKR
ncbi:MAG: translation initiation factor IF-2 [Clostridia bacterium]|nr:translation initiation factor IF-2 [Clostridia bacterium]